jgi:2-phosphosulfolactate phosphatase
VTGAVIDVVRATTTLAVMGERGAARVIVAGSIDAARALRAVYPAALLIGESHALAPPGFDYGNSPQEIGAAEIAGRALIFATTNGTRALLACRDGGASMLVAAALRNAGAVAALALRDPDRPFALDLYVAGTIAMRIVAGAQLAGVILTLTEGAQMALTIAGTSIAPGTLLRRSEAGQAVIAAGLESDLDWCAELDTTRIVPRVMARGPQGELVVVFETGG